MNFTGIFRCAFCGKENEIFVEPEGGNEQILIEDCVVCCRPNVLHIHILNQKIYIDAEFDG
ncbi:MAG: CPXCG motif-containing cysteine-rich protein [Bacteroidota bacterium]